MKRKLHISAVSCKGGRENNEDNFYVKKRRYPEIVTRDERYSYTTKGKNCCFAVADGMGGVQHKVVVLVLEKYSDFSKGRDKNQRMRYSKEVRVLINRYGEEVFAACLGKWLIQEILRLYRLNIIHRDIKTGNILVKHLCKDLFETKFVLVDWGSSHLKSFDAYSGSNDPIDFKDYTEAEGAGTLKYYPPISTEGKHTYRSELFACAMVLCDIFGYLRETNLSVRFNIEHDENVSAEMKRALLILSNVDPDKRDYTSALKIFDSIIDKYKSSLVDKKSSKEFSAEQKNHKKEAASTDITCSFDEVVHFLFVVLYMDI